MSRKGELRERWRERFEDGGGRHEPGNSGGLWKLEKARK